MSFAEEMIGIQDQAYDPTHVMSKLYHHLYASTDMWQTSFVVRLSSQMLLKHQKNILMRGRVQIIF